MQHHGQSPYAKSIKVKVICQSDIVHYRNDKHEDRQLLNAVIADNTQAVKCTIYDVQKFNRFIEGNTIIIINCNKKTESIVVTANTKVFPSGNIDVPVAIEREGRAILFPPHARLASVAEALNSPPKVVQVGEVRFYCVCTQKRIL
jgi:3D (Asp-Asp-Asp) domain-containing protein